MFIYILYIISGFILILVVLYFYVLFINSFIKVNLGLISAVAFCGLSLVLFPFFVLGINSYIAPFVFNARF